MSKSLTATMTWVIKSRATFNEQRPRALSLRETRSELERLGILVIESQLRNDRHAHRIGAEDWRDQAKEILAAGFVPSPDNDVGTRKPDIRSDIRLADAFIGDEPPT
jgi:hypothetical protein